MTRVQNDHNYSKLSCSEVNPHIDYADDVDFVCKNRDDAAKTMDTIKQVFPKYDLNINESKTEIIDLKNNDDLEKSKKLGSLLDDDSDIARRIQLSNLAMLKLNKIWKNHYINIHHKMQIYNTYVRSILTYNASTWAMNVARNNKMDIAHRKHLRKCLNVFYPKIISNETLYAVTKQAPVSNFIQKRRKSHLGHILRRDNSARDAFMHVDAQPAAKKRSKPSNLLKTYRKDFGTEDFEGLEELAVARKF